jgi:hypothetical protein
MAKTIKVKLDDGGKELCAESSNALKGAKEEKLIEISPYQVRTLIDVSSITSNVKKQIAFRESQNVAEKFADKLFKQIDDMMVELKALVAKDKNGDGTAAAKAKELVKTVGDEIEETLTDFGKLIRKTVETKAGKLPSGTKSVSSGGFRGIRLVAKFENAGASGLKVELTNAAAKKWLGEKESILLKNMTEAIQKTGADTDGLEKVGNLYEIKCEKNPKCRIICEVKGNKLTMLAVYEFAPSGAKTLIAGEEVKELH